MVKARKTATSKQTRGAAPRKGRVMSIRLIISLATVLLISVSVVCVGWVAERNARDALTKEIENRLLLEARNLAFLSVDALLSPYPELTLCPVVKEMQSGRPDLAFVIVLNHQGLIQGHVELRELGQRFGQVEQFVPTPNSLNLVAGEAMIGDREMLVASVPVIHPNGKNLGTALVGMRRAYLEELITRARYELVLFTAGLLAIGTILALFLMSQLLRPVGDLRQGLERIGRGDLDTPLQLKDRTELGLLADTVNGMAARLKASQVEMLEKERLTHEMDLAHQMQQSLMPEAATKIDDFVIDGSYQAAAEVGGDYYDVFRQPDGRTGMVIADVAGKGLAGCMVTSMIAVLMKTLREDYASPAQLLVALEDVIKDSLEPGVFITVFYGLLDSTTGEMIYASAGHSPLFLYRSENQSVKRLRTRGIPVGALRGGALRSTLEDYVVTLTPGDMAVQYTDGINEAWNPRSDTDFGFDRIEEAIIDSAAQGPRGVLDRLESDVATWSHPHPPQDDQTMLVISREPVPECRSIEPRVNGGVMVQDINPRDQLSEMLEDSYHLLMKAKMEQLEDLRGWIESCPGLMTLGSFDKQVVENSLYEACANIIEHGYQGDASQEIDLWWLPACVEAASLARTRKLLDTGDAEADKQNCLGYFILCDRGLGFAPVNWAPPDLGDPQVRRRGRGLGMHIIHTSMEKVIYIPDTPTGNLTLLRFDPHKPEVKGDVCNV